MIQNKFIRQLLLLTALPTAFAQAQVLTLPEAVQQALSNYGTIRAKSNYADASRLTASQTRREYLPNLVVSAQQDFGTVNGQNGPLYGFGGYGVASSGLPLPAQNWNAAFGALYLANINWEFFTFGRVRERIKVSDAIASRDARDLDQEKFQHQVRTSAAYLNLLAAQRITLSQQKNLERAMVFRNNAVTRAANGLIAGVDSSQANAEVANARIAVTKAQDLEQEMSTKLAVLMGVPPANYELDTTFITHIPGGILDTTHTATTLHPLRRFYEQRVKVSNEQVKFLNRGYYPSFSMFGIFQTRGSGFEAAYTQNQTAFTQDYGTGITPTRSNYLFGVGMNWNLTTLLRNHPQVRAQQLVTQGLRDEYELASQQIDAQMSLANTKIKNALTNYNEAIIQVKAASDAYLQKSTLYRNGLTNIVDVTQTLYALNRAETERDIAYSNVWQALLLKSAAAGDTALFMNEL
jgi:outer membrane protein TolC